MKLKVLPSDVDMSEPVVMLNRDDCLELGVGPVDRILITAERSIVTSIVTTDSEVCKGCVGMPSYVLGRCGARARELVDVAYSPMPESVRSIRKKINGHRLNGEEIGAIVGDIMEGNLSEKEILAFVSSFNVNNADIAEIAQFTRSMASTGITVDFGTIPVMDFHSLGGVPGNKITPIVVSIVASEGLLIPKMSSRAISSACGTSDFVDTFCDVELDRDLLTDAVRKTNGVFACGNEDYAPVGRRIIRAERPMGIDPRPTMLASIMSKKVAIGTTHLLIDIPMGDGSKIPDIATAREYARDLTELGTKLDIHVECGISRADEPIGRMIGPILEAKECIEVLERGDGDPELVDKACGMAGILLEMAGERDGKERALEILGSGAAHRKFLEIVAAQNGDPELRSDDLVPGRFVKDVHAKRSGYIQFIDNAGMVAIAKGAGAPSDPGAGLEMLHKKGDRVREGDVLFRIYAENQAKLDRAVESARSRRPMNVQDVPVPPVGRMILERIPSKKLLDLIRFARRSE